MFFDNWSYRNINNRPVALKFVWEKKQQQHYLTKQQKNNRFEIFHLYTHTPKYSETQTDTATRDRRRHAWREMSESALTVGSRVCSKVSGLWSSSSWWEAADTPSTANTPRATSSRSRAGGSGQRWVCDILHTHSDGRNLNLQHTSDNKYKCHIHRNSLSTFYTENSISIKRLHTQ